MFRPLQTAAVLAAMLVSLMALAQDWPDTDADTEGEDTWGFHDPQESEPSPWFDADDDQESGDGPDRLRLYDERGRSTGRAERNPVFEKNYDLYDERGRRTGRVQENPVLEDRYSVYDERGRRVQEIRKNPVLDNQYDVYDERGRRVGKISGNPVIDGQYDIYDERGRRVGEARSE